MAVSSRVETAGTRSRKRKRRGGDPVQAAQPRIIDPLLICSLQVELKNDWLTAFGEVSRREEASVGGVMAVALMAETRKCFPDDLL